MLKKLLTKPSEEALHGMSNSAKDSYNQAKRFTDLKRKTALRANELIMYVCSGLSLLIGSIVADNSKGMAIALFVISIVFTVLGKALKTISKWLYKP